MKKFSNYIKEYNASFNPKFRSSHNLGAQIPSLWDEFKGENKCKGKIEFAESFVEDWFMQDDSSPLFPTLVPQPSQEKEWLEYNEREIGEIILRKFSEFSKDLKEYNASLDAKFENSHNLDVPVLPPCDEIESEEECKEWSEREKYLVKDLLGESDSSFTIPTLIP